MAEAPKTSSGVQELIARLRDDGVQAGREEAEMILADARREAARMVEEGRAEVKALREKAEAEIESLRTATLEAVRLAARDTILELKSVCSRAFQNHVKRLVSKATRDEGLLKALVLVLAGEVADKYINDKEAQILLSEALFTGKANKKLRDRSGQIILALSGEMLREGIELIPASDVHGGARVKLVDENLEIDLTDEAISRLLEQRMLPRFLSILEGKE